MCISVNDSVCNNYIDFTDTYTLDFTDEEDGEKVIYVYYKDTSGNIIATPVVGSIVFVFTYTSFSLYKEPLF